MNINQDILDKLQDAIYAAEDHGEKTISNILCAVMGCIRTGITDELYNHLKPFVENGLFIIKEKQAREKAKQN